MGNERGGPVVLWEPLHPDAETELAAHHPLRHGLEADLGGAVALITRGQGRITAAVLAAAGPQLACVARVGAGTDNVDVAAASARGLPVFYTPDAFTAPTAEHALALLLALARRVPQLDGAVRAGNWAARAVPRTEGIAGLRLGIIGLGRIGRRFGELAASLGMEVRAWSRAARDDRFPHTDLERLLGTCDVISLHLSLEPETQGFLDAARIASLKPGAMLINVSRGGLVDEGALAAALRAGHLRGAAVDVLAQEPPPPDHPLLGLPNILITPHTAALTAGAFRAASLQVAGAVGAFLKTGRADPGVVRNPAVLTS